MKNYLRRGTAMRLRGVGALDCSGFIGPLTADQQAACDAQQLSDIKNFFYQAGQADASGAPASGLPGWLIPAGIGLLGFVLLSKAMR